MPEEASLIAEQALALRRDHTDLSGEAAPAGGRPLPDGARVVAVRGTAREPAAALETF
jgi:hypothetical protein